MNALSATDGILRWQKIFEGQLASGVKLLLETKHLYQSVTIEYQDKLEEFRQRLVHAMHEGPYLQTVNRIRTKNWVIADPSNPTTYKNQQAFILLTVPDASCFAKPAGGSRHST